ncbi:RTA1 domain-containing protein [Aspergillus aculeatinus CBS 121060]|uniref:RTA1-domain-containing protein n=1 Tax=Aspergillus aculeatinus CBS 121060 TaxID=1448322 RepID=A0ACD1GY51_9EURO|nr:RTA1-domain-containing protein [Aspergillus aculeatinus CBS 121060]RAH66143.1 RTA1-domain-containing protein [Aspergillus aculeatinus CBS 121060]
MEGYSQDTCHAYVAGVETSYGYVPSLTAASWFVAFFGLSMLIHTAQVIYYRAWGCAVFSIGCLVELLGWAARIWSAKCPYAQTPYMIQITTLIIAPTFFTAGIYVILARLVSIFGRSSSLMPPELYVWIFCICDVIALGVQGAGGGMASSGGAGAESSSSSGSSSQTTGTHIMVGGIIFQLVCITLFVGLATDFVLRLSKQQPKPHATIRSNTPLLFLGGATVFSLLLIYIRSVYRTIELLHGWTSATMRNEKLLIGLDGAMMVPAVWVYNLLHPAYLLPKIRQNADCVDAAQGFQMEGRMVSADGVPAQEVVVGGKDDCVTLLKRT